MKTLNDIFESKWFGAFSQIFLFASTCYQTLDLILGFNNISQDRGIQFVAIFLFSGALYSLCIIFVGVMLARYGRHYFVVPMTIVNSLLLFSTSYGWLYQISGLYSTHCGTVDISCQTVPTHNGFDMFYFSITTLTTLGVGDYIPANNMCKIFVETEAILGYLVLAFSIAALTNLMQRKD